MTLPAPGTVSPLIKVSSIYVVTRPMPDIFFRFLLIWCPKVSVTYVTNIMQNLVVERVMFYQKEFLFRKFALAQAQE